MADNAYPYDTSHVRELLKQKRKTRGIRSCFPCRHRKVKCDGLVPCSSCIKRSHPELCQLPPSSDAAEHGNDGSSMSRRAPRQRSDANLELRDSLRGRSCIPSPEPASIIARLERIEEQISSLKADLRATATESTAGTASASPSTGNGTASRPLHGVDVGQDQSPGRHVLEDATGATLFLGRHSDDPLALGCREASVSGDVLFQDAIINQFVPRTYPFTSLWGPDATVHDVCETLPDDPDMIRYWQAYQPTAYPFYPALVAVDEFGRSLFSFLNERASFTADSADSDKQRPEPDCSWLALLFAVMACGVQFTDDPTKERDLRSKVFICSSFHCLRMSNFFNHTNLDQIQAMALIGHCLRNNLDTNSAWILMGSTIRLAQSIGLHEPSPSVPPAEQKQRTWLWWTLIWQDTFLSFTYDRPPSCFITKTCPLPYARTMSGLSFHECIFKICHIILDQTQRERTVERGPAADYRHQLEAVWDTAAPFLTSKAHCTSLQDHLERLALGVHLAYALCRMNLVYLDLATPDTSSTVATDCRRWAMQVVECFLELHRLSPGVCRSWAFVHNAVSCAITLHRLGQGPSVSDTMPAAIPEAMVLARRLIAVLENEARKSEWYDADTNVRYFGPYSRSLKALQETYTDLFE